MNLDALDYLKKYRPDIYNEYIRYTKRDLLAEGKCVILFNSSITPAKVFAIKPEGSNDIVLNHINSSDKKIAYDVTDWWKYMAIVEEDLLEEERDNYEFKCGQFREDYVVEK